MGRGRQNFQMTPNFCVPVNTPTFFNQTPYGSTQQMHNPPKVFKRFNNWNYCFTHGFDVADGHTSATCLYPSWNHNWNATRNNTMGGSQKDAYKVVLPSQQQGGYQGQNFPYT